MSRCIAMLCTCAALAAQAAPADRLVELARRGESVDPGYIHRDVVALLGTMEVMPALRERFDRIGGWSVRRLAPGERVDGDSDVVIVARGNAHIGSVSRAVVIAANDVEIDEGGDVVVVAGGNVKFRQGRLNKWGGVFVARGSFTAPWLARAAVHAAGGAKLTHASLDLMFYNTGWTMTSVDGLEMRSGPALFEGARWAGGPVRPARLSAEALHFAGERCTPPVPMRDIRARVTEMALRKLQCKAIDVAIVTCDAKAAEELWTVHGCTDGFTEIIARRRGEASEFAYVPPPAPQGSQAVRIGPKPPAPGECPAENRSPKCMLDRIAKGEPAMPEQPITCPAPQAAVDGRVDQMKRAWTGGTGGGRSKVGGLESASFFELVKPVQVNGLEWSGIAARADHSETFVVRLFRDADGVPGALVKELRVGARLTPATEVKYPPSTGTVYLFGADTPPIDLPAGRYWLSLLEPPDSEIRFFWEVERDATGPCGSGSARRANDRESWGSLYANVAPRRVYGYSFALDTRTPPR